MTQHDKKVGRASARASAMPHRAVGKSGGNRLRGLSPEVSRTLAAAAARAPKKTAAPRTSGRPVKSVPPAEPVRVDLPQQLAEAEARILELEARLSGLADRIAWIADRLHGLLDDET